MDLKTALFSTEHDCPLSTDLLTGVIIHIMTTYVFVDASNLFYGGEKSLGWKIDYKKLLAYLKEKYGATHIFYFGGVETHGFRYDYLNNETVPIRDLEQYLTTKIKDEGKGWDDAKLILYSRHLQRIRFYIKLEQFGYTLFLKPVKLYEQNDGTTKRKANCDVDMAFYLMKEGNLFDRVLVLSGDGDFLPVLKYLKQSGKEVLILSRGPRTAKEIKQFAGSRFLDFTRLRHKLAWVENE
ncbi:MAG: NYN domain-containing protein [bacterium]|nr:NYN domain-containing protein [bacterium]